MWPRCSTHGFVAVKVDREERPDVDAVYMEAVQLLTGARRLAHDRARTTRRAAVLGRHVLTEGQFREPSRAGQEPLDNASGRPSRTTRRAWRKRCAKGRSRRCPEQEWRGHLALRARCSGGLTAAALSNAVEGLLARFDPQWGGFGSAPKFPQATSLEAAGPLLVALRR